jgi:cytochrome oxidase assembly protein ShyY1
MIALLRTPRWIGFTVLVIVAIIGFGLLSNWQWQRADQHRLERLTIEQGQVVSGATSDASGLSEFSRISVTGTFESNINVLVRQRPLDGGNGYWVMTPLRINGQPNMLWVLRGWLAASTQAIDVPAIPPAPQGPVTIDGAVRYFETPRSDVAGLPEGVISRMSIEELPAIGDTQDRVLQLIQSDPAGTLTIVPLPAVDEGQNISYAIQWILFALVASTGWVIFLRREAKEDASHQSMSESEN